MNGLGKWRWIVPAALVAALALSGSTLAAPVGQISEFPTPSPASQPQGIVAGPDGNLWFAEFNAGKIAEVNPATGAITEFATPTPNSHPLGITTGPDGNVWFTEFTADQIGRINPATGAVTEFPIPTAASGPVAIVFGPNGNLWFTQIATDQLAEINPATGAVTEIPVPTTNSQPFGIGVGPDGNIWFTEKAASKIAEFNLSTSAFTEIPTPTASSAPNAISAGPDGSLWFTESAAAASRVGLVDTTAAPTITEFPTPTANSSPVVIVPGADGNMWFTEGNADKVAEINPVTRAITEFSMPTASSSPVGIAPGSDGNLWFTENAAAKVGSIGAGAPGAAAIPPSVSGAPQPGQTLTCNGATWSSWAAQQPTFGFGFDGFRWLLDGSQIAGATAQTFSVPAADVGHQISCEEIATYPLVAATVSSASGAVTISPSLGASLVSTTATPTSVSLTLSCQGLPTQRCTGAVELTSHVTTQGSKVIAVAAKAKKKPKPKPPKKVTKVETIASGSYSVGAGKSTTVKLTLNSTGKKVLTARYKVPATLTVSGTSSLSKTVTLSYGRLHVVPAYQWAFSKTFAFATQLTLGSLPHGSRVALLCHGRGCPFSKRTFAAPKHGKLQLAPALKQRHLAIHSTVELQITAANVVGEVVRFTVVPGKLPPETFLCLPPGAHTPSACAR